MPHSIRKRWVLGLLAIALTARVTVALWLPGEAIFSDGNMYDRLAMQILESKSLLFDSEERAAPLHPIVLASVYGVCGQSVTAARLCAALLGTAACYAAFALGRILFGTRAGLLALGALSVYPLHVYVSGLYEYPTALFTAVLLTATCAAVYGVQRPGVGWISLATGSLFGIAALAVPTALTAVPLLVVCILAGQEARMRVRLRAALLTVVGCAGVVGSWSALWYAETGEFRLIAAYGAYALFKGNCAVAHEYGNADVADEWIARGLSTADKPAYAAYVAVQDRAALASTRAEAEDVYRRAAIDYVLENPADAAGLFFRKLCGYWWPYATPVTQSALDNWTTRAVQVATFVPILGLALVGVIRGGFRQRTLWVVYCVILSQWITYSAFIVSTRYRLQVDPLLIVLAIGAVVGPTNRRKQRCGAESQAFGQVEG